MGTTLPSEVYEFNYGEEGRILRCPWHSWEYNIRTGESVFDKNVRIVSYAVEIVDGEIAVSI
jgi:nitrite reductase (NADH) small subunit